MNNILKPRVAYFHRKISHRALNAYATALQSKFFILDDYGSGRISKYIFWLRTLFTFPLRNYDAIITDSPQVLPVLLKIISFNRLKLINTQASSVILEDYFNDNISKSSKKALKYCTNYYDLSICTGEFQYEMTSRMRSKNSKTIIVESFNGIRKSRMTTLDKVIYNAKSNKIISLSNIPSKDQVYIKGIDKMLTVFTELAKDNPQLEYIHIGNCNDTIVRELKDDHPHLLWNKIKFVGRQQNLEDWFKDAILLLHLSRMDAFPLAITESFYAGLPAFISNNVGIKKMYTEVQDGDLFISSSEEEAIKDVGKYLNKDQIEKQKISKTFKVVSKEYTADKAEKNYVKLVLENLFRPNN